MNTQPNVNTNTNVIMNNTDSNSLISVIVPVYNVKPYLDKCIESIRNQTHENLEIILVDDGSVDSSAAQCDFAALSDDRCLTVHKKNGGQAEARNYGISVSSGDYIGFVDSDDYIHTRMYEILLSQLFTHDADATECGMIKFSNQGTQSDIFSCNEESAESIQPSELELAAVLVQPEIIRGLISGRCFTDTVPNMLVRANIAKAVQFDVGKIHEDILWPYRVLSKCKKAVSIPAALYAYLQREGSTMNSAYSEKRFDGLDALQRRAEEIKKDWPELYPVAERSYAGSCMYQYQYLARQPKSAQYDSFMEILHQRFCQSDIKAFLPSTEFKYKIWYRMFILFPQITSKIRNMLRIGL